MDRYSLEGGEVRDGQETVKNKAIQEVKKHKMMRWSWKTYLACLCSVFVSLGGGAILAFWVVKHHHSNTQLWMVPAGLILFSTPVIILFSAIFSDLSCAAETVSASSSTCNHSIV